MGSSSRPTSRSPRRHESKSSGMKPLPRRATTKVPVSSKHRLSIHNPFHHSPSPSTTTNASAPRPQMPNRQNSVQTRYMEMLLNLDTIPRLHNILASFFTWILLAGFLVFPGTFTSISSKLDDDPQFQENGAASDLLKHVKHIPLLYVAAFCSGIGALGMIWMWWRWRENFVWLLNRIFLPGCLNSFAGLISTLINVYSQQDGVWSVTAFVTVSLPSIFFTSSKHLHC